MARLALSHSERPAGLLRALNLHLRLRQRHSYKPSWVGALSEADSKLTTPWLQSFYPSVYLCCYDYDYDYHDYVYIYIYIHTYTHIHTSRKNIQTQNVADLLAPNHSVLERVLSAGGGGLKRVYLGVEADFRVSGVQGRLCL